MKKERCREKRCESKTRGPGWAIEQEMETERERERENNKRGREVGEFKCVGYKIWIKESKAVFLCF